VAGVGAYVGVPDGVVAELGEIARTEVGQFEYSVWSDCVRSTVRSAIAPVPQPTLL
jgi:hypothetical protein